jgi:hypothetical protein
MDTTGARYGGIDRGTGRMTEARGDIAVRPQQIGRSRFRIIALPSEPF